MDNAPVTTGHDERALIEAYVAGSITREEMLDGLCRIARPAHLVGGGGYVRGTRDVIERATREGLLTEADWNALVARADDCPALFAIA